MAERATKSVNRLRLAMLSIVDELKRRDDLKLKSDVAVSEYLGWSRQTISYWRSGTRVPTISQLCDFCITFKVDANTLIKGGRNTDLVSSLERVEERVTELENIIKELQQNTGKKSGKKVAKKAAKRKK